VLARIKADPRLADIPVVFVTSRVTTDDVVEGLRLGAHDYLRKPFEPSELLARVHAAVRIKALQDELRLRNAELELTSRTDALTGLHNRRHLEEQLQRLAGAGDRLAVLLCDIDRFKQVNDTRGHAAGDEVLRLEEPLAVTTSVGVAAGTEDGWEGLVRRADTGLYAAKEGGRDRVVAGPAAGSPSFTPEGQDAARYR
jgi:PleD family two-component response regulator